MKIGMLREHWVATRAARGVHQGRPARADDDGGPLCVAVLVSGGVGDLIVIARFLRDLQAAAGPFRFDLFFRHSATADWVFAGVEGYRACYSDFLFDRLKDEYSAAMRISSFVLIFREVQGHRLRENVSLCNALDDIDRFRSKISVFVDRHPFMDGFLGQKAVYMNRTRADFLHLMARIPYAGPRLDLPVETEAVEALGLAGTRYITVHTGFDPDFVISGGRATKCYPHTNRLVELLKQRLSGYVFVQIGVPSTSERLAAVDVCLLGRTRLAGAAALVGGAVLHIDNEGGLVHIAAALGVRSCVLFGPTSPEYFGYADNINVRPAVCGGCWWINDTWMDLCPRGFETPRCLSEQPPEAVADIIVASLAPQPTVDAVAI